MVGFYSMDSILFFKEKEENRPIANLTILKFALFQASHINSPRFLFI